MLTELGPTYIKLGQIISSGRGLFPEELVDEFRAGTYDAQILLTKVDNPSQFGVAELGPNGGVTTLVEKPKEPRSDLALVGVYMFRRGIHDAVRAIKPSARGELEITDALQWLIDEGRDVRPHLVTGYWKDTGRLEDMLECNRKVLESVEPVVHGTVIGRDTVLRDTYVGPFTSIYFGCLLEDTEIEHSIVLEQSTIRGVGRIEDSLIGKEVEVSPSTALPKAHRLMLGDHSRVSIA